MARRLSVQEESEIVQYMRDRPEESERRVAQKFRRSRPIIARLKARYGLQSPDVVAAPSEGAALPPEDAKRISRHIRRELAKTDRGTAAWWRGLSDAEREAIVKKGPTESEKPQPGDPSYLDLPLGSFERG